MQTKTVVSTLIAAAALAAPAAASADSILYRDQGKLMLASPDGAQKVEIAPSSSSYHAASQADDGTIVAARPGGFDILARDGRVLRQIATKPHRAANGGWHDGTPNEVAISPDGKLVAYEYYDVTCPAAGGPCLPEHTVLYSTTEGPTATDPQVYGVQYNREAPEFVTNDRVLLMGGYGAWTNLDTVGGGDSSDETWWSGDTDINDGAFSRDGSRFGAVLGYDDDAVIALITTPGDPRTGMPGQPGMDNFVCNTEADAKLANPTWAPDGLGVAYESAKGIEVVRFTTFAPGDCGVAGSSVLSPTASEPDWGPAGLPAAPVATAGGSGGQQTSALPGGKPGTGTGAAGGQAGSTAGVRLGKVKATTAALRKGLRVKLTLAAPGRVTVKLAKGRTTVAKGGKTAKAGAVDVRLSRVSRPAAKRLRGKRLTLSVTTATGTARKTVKVG